MKRSLWMLMTLCTTTGRAIAEPGIQFALPIACTLGTDCFIQQYADVVPGKGERDYSCGSATYDGHNGTDFRVLSLDAAARGVTVLASAPGKVRAMRDGVKDRLVATREEIADLDGRACGNAVVIDHGGGWVTLYCHLRRGSVLVRSGDMVAAGKPLGLVGYSGNAQFAHVHLTVLRNGKVVDPFSGKEQDGACGAQDAELSSSLWAPAVRPNLAYSDAVIIEAGFAGKPVSTDDAEQGLVAPPAAKSPGLVFYGRLINLSKGDSLRLSAIGPGDFTSATSIAPFDRPKAAYVGFTGKRLTGERWPSGRYQGRIEVLRGGKIIGRREAAFDLP